MGVLWRVLLDREAKNPQSQDSSGTSATLGLLVPLIVETGFAKFGMRITESPWLMVYNDRHSRPLSSVCRNQSQASILVLLLLLHRSPERLRLPKYQTCCTGAKER